MITWLAFVTSEIHVVNTVLNVSDTGQWIRSNMPSSLTSLALTIIMSRTMQNVGNTFSLIIRQMESRLTVITNTKHFLKSTVFNSNTFIIRNTSLEVVWSMVKIDTSFTTVILVNLTVENVSITDFLISRCVESCFTVLTKVGVLGLVVQTVSNVKSTNRVATGSMISWVTIRTQVVCVSLTVENVWITDF